MPIPNPATTLPYVVRDLEESLILLIARRNPDSEAVGEAVKQVEDWRRVMTMAARHGLLPLMARHIAGLNVPSTVARLLTVARIQTEYRNRTTISELLRFTNALESRNVASIAFKGPVAAVRYLDDVAMRDFSDFDVLVERSELPAVDEVIRDLEYSRLDYHLPEEQRANRQRGREEPWLSRSGAVLDLHWTLDGFVPFRLSVAELLSRSVIESLPGGTVRAVCDEDDLIVLAAHAAAHGFERLEWVMTVGEAMCRPALDWEAVTERARRARCCTALVVACTLASRLLGYHLPDGVRALPARANDAQALVRRYERDLFRERNPDWQELRGWWRRLRMFDCRSDALRGTYRKIVIPGFAESRALPLPRHWHFVYFLVRPVRLAYKYARLVGTRVWKMVTV